MRRGRGGSDGALEDAAEEARSSRDLFRGTVRLRSADFGTNRKVLRSLTTNGGLRFDIPIRAIE